MLIVLPLLGVAGCVLVLQGVCVWRWGELCVDCIATLGCLRVEKRVMACWVFRGGIESDELCADFVLLGVSGSRRRGTDRPLGGPSL